MVRFVVSVFLACWAVSAHAQTPATSQAPGSIAEPSGRAATPGAPPRLTSASGQVGTILGVVTDSLHNGPLAGALVTVIQLPRKSVMTSPTGAFRIDSLPPGRYTLDIQHPVIDSLGIQVRSDTLMVTAGTTQTAFLSVPGAARIAAAVCSPLQQRLGPAVLVGEVLDADTDAPAGGAEVSVVWVETEANVHTGVHTTPRLRKATVAPNGTFRVCGLPLALNATLQASLGTAKTGEIGFETTGEPLTLKVLRLPSSTPDALSPQPAPPTLASAKPSSLPVPLQTGRAVITGRITNRGGVPIVGAQVTIQGGGGQASSGKDGRFTLSGAPAGTQLILVRYVGYDPVQTPFDVTTRGPNTLAIRLGDYHQQLASVAVTTKAAPTALDRTGFTRRKKTGLGHYLTEDQIAKAQPVYMSDMLRHIIGLHIFGSGRNASITSSRGEGCVRYLIDRNNINAQDGLSIDELVNPADVAGIEFYQSSEIPAELSSGANAGCSLLVVWTRQKLPPSSQKP